MPYSEDLAKHADVLMRFAPYDKPYSDALALIVPPRYVFIDHEVLRIGDKFVAWNLWGEYEHLDFANRIALCSYCYPYECLAQDLILYSAYSPEATDAEACTQLAGDVLCKLSLIYGLGEIADETAVMLRVLSMGQETRNMMNDAYSRVSLFPRSTKMKIPLDEFVRLAQVTYVESSRKHGGAHAKAVEVGTRLLERCKGSAIEAHAALCRTSTLDLVDRDLLTWDISKMKEDFAGKPELYDRDFRLKYFLKGKRIPYFVPHASRKAMCLVYFPEILRYGTYFGQHPCLPEPFRRSILIRYKEDVTATMIDLFGTADNLTVLQIFDSSRGVLLFAFPKRLPDYPLWITRKMLTTFVADKIINFLWGRHLLPSDRIGLTFLEILNSRLIPKKVRKSYSRILNIGLALNNMSAAPSSELASRLQIVRNLFQDNRPRQPTQY
jgi:hypothetical protein